MDMLSFATGLAIGKKKYGGGNSIFQDILRYSTQVNTIPIDSTYKYTINYWWTDRFEFKRNYFGYNFHRKDMEGGSTENGTLSFIYQLRHDLMCFFIAWENNVPLYAIAKGTGTLEDEVGSIMVNTDSENGKYYFFKSEEYIAENLVPHSNIELIATESGMWFTYTSGSYTLRKNKYAQSGECEVSLVSSSTESMTLSTNGTLLYPDSDSQTFSDLTHDQVYDKFAQIYKAALIANGIRCRDALIIQPT